MKTPLSRQTVRPTRRLGFEHCEPRLMLSGEGGYISFDVEGLLSTAASDFVLTSSSNYVVDFTGSRGGQDSDSQIGMINRDSFWHVLNSYLDNGQSIRLKMVSLDGELSQQTISYALSHRQFEDLIDGTLSEALPGSPQVSGTPYTPPDLFSNGSPLVPQVGASAPLGLPAAEFAEDGVALAASSRESFVAPPRMATLPPITAEEALLLGRDTAKMRQQAEVATELTEGGAIEVGQAVADAQRAYESDLFAEAARELQRQGSLAHATIPRAEPLVGELARAVVFELVGQEPSPDEAVQLDEAQAPSAALPETPQTDALPGLAVRDEENPDAESRAVAFSHWPLYFSVVLSGVLANRLRQARSDTTQQPPRRRDR